jgi:hypothetical protein
MSPCLTVSVSVSVPTAPDGACAAQTLGRRVASLRSLFRAAAASTMLGALAACGGGGGATAPAPSPTPTPAPSPTPPSSAGPIDAVLSVPDPVGYDSERLAVFTRLNQIRLSAGLGMLAQQVQMDQAAQAHAQWEVANDVDSHQEVVGTTGFTGVDFTDRELAKGYVPVDAMEVACSGGGGVACVDLLVNIAYHRAAILAFEPVDVGIGRSELSASTVAQPIVVDIASPGVDPVRGQGQRPQAYIADVAIWPLDGAINVPLRMGLERPNPVPAVDVGMLGTPISLTVPQSRALALGSFTLTASSSNATVTLASLDRTHDPNGLVPPSYVVAVPLAPLEPATTYTVSFVGTVADIPGGTPVALTRRWSFTTGSQ